MGVDALRDAVIHPEGRRDVHDPAVDDLLRRLCVGARGAGPLDPEQVVVAGREDTLAPAGFVDGLRDRHRGGHAVLALRRHGTARHRPDEGPLGGGAGRGHRGRRDVVPVVRGERAWRRRIGVVHPLEQPGDGGLTGLGAPGSGGPQPGGGHLGLGGPGPAGRLRLVASVPLGRLRLVASVPLGRLRLVASPVRYAAR
jgi:hypothetical protein